MIEKGVIYERGNGALVAAVTATSAAATVATTVSAAMLTAATGVTATRAAAMLTASAGITAPVFAAATGVSTTMLTAPVLSTGLTAMIPAELSPAVTACLMGTLVFDSCFSVGPARCLFFSFHSLASVGSRRELRALGKAGRVQPEALAGRGDIHFSTHDIPDGGRNLLFRDISVPGSFDHDGDLPGCSCEKSLFEAGKDELSGYLGVQGGLLQGGKKLKGVSDLGHGGLRGVGEKVSHFTLCDPHA